mmetsp:Transcript_24104/g.35798  ORF Transcript_24104/g.35798 Transcript_24104/m.35798 type:complete len:474 (+) Transcript_24104:112-1533(+)
MTSIKVDEETKQPVSDSLKTGPGKKQRKIFPKNESSTYLQKQQFEELIKNALFQAKIGDVDVKAYPKNEPLLTADRLQQEVVFGKVKGSPYGACLKSQPNKPEDEEEAAALASQWDAWRKKKFTKIHFPIEGFDHMYGKKQIDEQEDYGAEAAALAAQFGPDTLMEEPDIEAAREYGSFRTPLDAPIGSLKDKWRVLPHFLQVRSLMRQHIDSFDYFVNTEMKEIVQSPSACEIRSEHDPKFYLRYTDCWVGEPNVEEDSYTTTQATPFQCRLRDATYSAPIYVNIRYTRGRQIVVKKKVIVGRIPIMLRSSKCLLNGKTEREVMAMKECPHDPGGYFVVKGNEKAILIQEQLSKNRVIIEADPKGNPCASITSSTRERKSKGYILLKHGKIYVKHNTLGDDIPFAIVMKAMGIESDMEMVQLVGSEPEIVDCLSLSLEEPVRLGISTQLQALRYIGQKNTKSCNEFFIYVIS